jgi:hypothetical protein
MIASLEVPSKRKPPRPETREEPHMSKHAGDPSPRSPNDVLADQRYRAVVNDIVWGPNSSRCVYLVVLHTGTETYWEASYTTTESDHPLYWRQVVPKRVERVEYQRI